MYLQDTAVGGTSLVLSEPTAVASRAVRRDLTLRIGITLLLTSGAVLGAINMLVTIRLVAAALGA